MFHEFNSFRFPRTSLRLITFVLAITYSATSMHGQAILISLLGLKDWRRPLLKIGNAFLSEDGLLRSVHCSLVSIQNYKDFILLQISPRSRCEALLHQLDYLVYYKCEFCFIQFSRKTRFLTPLFYDLTHCLHRSTDNTYKLFCNINSPILDICLWPTMECNIRTFQYSVKHPPLMRLYSIGKRQLPLTYP